MDWQKFVCFGLFFFIGDNAHALCVNVDKANLRYGPSASQKKTWEVYRNMPFQKLKSENGWYRVKDVDGDIHWIFGNLVTEKYKCAVIKVKTANLRTGPGTQHNPVPWGPAQKYYAFKIIDTKGDWHQIEDSAGGKAWVHKNLVWVQ